MPVSDVSIRFLGAAGTVTGSRFLVESAGTRVLVDCGLFQGFKQLRERNREDFPVPPATIDAVVLTHAHLDHSGYLPALVRDGYKGAVHCTAGTRDLARLLLPDSGRLLEEGAEHAERHGYCVHATPAPLYTERDAQNALCQLQPHRFNTRFEIETGVSVTFVPAGHIVGAAQVLLELGSRRILFSGDLGRPEDALMAPPAPPPDCDILLCESTYGDRVHPAESAPDELGGLVRRVAARGGVLVIPAFAIGRAQSLMLHLSRLCEAGDIPAIPVYLNSPMATDATKLFENHVGEHRLTRDECARAFGHVKYVNSVEESKALNRRRGPMVIISASGMATGGRVLHHIEAFGPDSRNAIVLSGYQAGGTRGAQLAGGARVLRMFGRQVSIAAEVVQLQSLSSHADSDDLLAWLGELREPPLQTFIVHGEPAAADALRARIRHELGWSVRVPGHLELAPLPERPNDGAARP